MHARFFPSLPQACLHDPGGHGEHCCDRLFGSKGRASALFTVRMISSHPSPSPSEAGILRTVPAGRFRSAFLLKIILPVLLSLLSFEAIALRYFNLEKSNDPILGRVFRAGHTVYSRVEGEGKAHYIQNGIRRTSPLPPGAPPPLLVLGDSFTEALQVNDEEVYTSVLERILREEGFPIPVLNVSTSGMSIVDYIVLAPEISRRTEQRWTVVELRENDFIADAWAPWKRHFMRDPGTGTLTVTGHRDTADNPRAPWLDSLFNCIALVPWTLQRLEALTLGSQHGPVLFHADRTKEAPSRKNMILVFNKDLYVEEMELLSRAYAGRLTLLLIAKYDPHSPYQQSREEAGIIRAAAALDLSLVDTRAAYGEFAAHRTSPFGFPNSRFNSGHMNAEGHADAARLLTREMLRLHQHDLF